MLVFDSSLHLSTLSIYFDVPPVNLVFGKHWVDLVQVSVLVKGCLFDRPYCLYTGIDTAECSGECSFPQTLTNMWATVWHEWLTWPHLISQTKASPVLVSGTEARAPPVLWSGTETRAPLY